MTTSKVPRTTTGTRSPNVRRSGAIENFAARARALFSLSGHAPGQYGSRKVQRAQRTGGWPPGDWKPWIDAPAWGRAPERLPLGAVAAAALAVVVRHLVLELKRVGLASPAHHGT